MSDDFASRLRRTAGDTRRFDPRRDFMLLLGSELDSAADRIDSLESELERFKRLLDEEHAKHMAALIRLHAIDTLVTDWSMAEDTVPEYSVRAESVLYDIIDLKFQSEAGA